MTPHQTAPSAGASPNIPSEAEERIEGQRRQLQQASTLLTCLWISTLYEEWHDVEIDAADVALVVRKMVDEAVEALDLVHFLRGHAQQEDAGSTVDDTSDDDNDEDEDPEERSSPVGDD